MNYYPIFLDLSGKKALVIGGGRVAQRKVETLLDYGASVRIVSKELTPRLRSLADEKRIQYSGPELNEDQFEGIMLVVSATDDVNLNHEVSRRAQGKGLLVNVVDQPEECNFILPSILRRGDLQVAVSTSGKSPALAKKIREELEHQFGKEYETMLRLMGKLREMILSKGLPQEQKRSLFLKLVESDMLEAMAKKDRERVEKILHGVLGDRFPVDTILESVLGSEG